MTTTKSRLKRFGGWWGKHVVGPTPLVDGQPSKPQTEATPVNGEAAEYKPPPPPRTDAKSTELPKATAVPQQVVDAEIAAATQAARTETQRKRPTRDRHYAGNAGNTPGGTMTTVSHIRDAADQLKAALAGYDPASMRQLVREMPTIGEALSDMAGGLRSMADRAEADWPMAGAVSEAIRDMAKDLHNAGGTAESATGAMYHHQESDIERHDAPRNGRAAESKWDLRSDEG